MIDKTKLVVLLDASGSMNKLLEDYIEKYNAFIEKQKKEAENDELTLIFFDSLGWKEGWKENYEIRIKTEYKDKPLHEVPLLTREVYKAVGQTPLYDAIGYTVDNVGKELAALKEEERPERVMVIIQTDGQENSSQKYTKEMIKERIKHQREVYKWEFLFLSADENSIKDAHHFGIKKDMAVFYASTSEGTRDAFNMASKATNRYRSS